MRIFYNLSFVLFICSFFSFTNPDDNRQEYQVRISKTNENIVVDGILDEQVWREADVADNFWLSFPIDDERADPKTEVRLAYNDQYIYISAVCYDQKDYIIQTLKRDVDFWSGDGFAFVLDPVNERTNGFLFGVSPLGVQMEGLISGNTGQRGSRFRGMNISWDNKWLAQVKNYEDRWTVEIAVPFKTLRYEDDKTTWGVNFLRSDMKKNTYHAWAKVPVQFRSIDLGYTGALVWDEAPKRVKGNISLIPYVTGSSIQNFEAETPEERKPKWDFGVGGDAKIAVSSSLNLDLTINPDFSQVEVDQQVTNLTRFSIRFPERRNFFLENSDIFEDFGTGSSRPFFSRRIGLDESNNPIPIAYGARLSGNLTKNTRIGLMNIHTNGDEDTYAQNYTAVAFRQRVLARSVVKGFLLNRQAMDGFDFQNGDYGRNAGLEFTYQSNDGNKRAWMGYNHSFKEGFDDKNYFIKAGFNLGNRFWNSFVSYNVTANNYFADMGFLQRMEEFERIDPLTNDTIQVRQGLHQLFTNVARTFYAKKESKINTQRFELQNFMLLTPNGHNYDRTSSFEYELAFKDRSRWELELRDSETELFEPLSFTNSDLYESIPIGRYKYRSVELQYRSDSRKFFSYDISGLYGSFYNGMRTSVRLGLNYRVQPWGNFGVRFDFNDLEFPDPYGTAQLFLISPRVEVNFSKSIFWTTFFQYNTQLDNFNINSRLQWRFSPMSDVFLVYTDNYSVDVFAPKNRAVVLKVNYWLNI